MNKALITKYIDEFNQYIKGQTLLIGYKTSMGTYEWTDLFWSDWENSVSKHIIVINDKYVEFRKAAAEGKIIQHIDGSDLYLPIFFNLPVNEYQIKPEEPEFKVGDWVTYIHDNTKKALRIDNIHQNRYYFVNFSASLLLHEIEKWQPKKGEVCIFWDSVNTGAAISKFSHMAHQRKYVTDLYTWSNCMPFTGVLPPHMKD